MVGDKAKNCCFAVYDKVKLRVEATTEFPLDIKCTLMLTEEDDLAFEEAREQHSTQDVPPSATQVLQEIQDSEV